MKSPKEGKTKNHWRNWMEIVSPGIVLFRNYFLRNEEVIHMADESPNWRPGTAGGQINPDVRITDIHDLDKSTELHGELLETFVDGINEYVNVYKQLQIKTGEHLRIGRYSVGGHYDVHADSSDGGRQISGILYLNDDFEGGETHFPNQNITIKPEAGMLVLFPSNFVYAHGSNPITDGKKYICISWFK